GRSGKSRRKFSGDYLRIEGIPWCCAQRWPGCLTRCRHAVPFLARAPQTAYSGDGAGTAGAALSIAVASRAETTGAVVVLREVIRSRAVSCRPVLIVTPSSTTHTAKSIGQKARLRPSRRAQHSQKWPCCHHRRRPGRLPHSAQKLD